MTIRVRIAPSPTGSDLHIGNVRTALFNYLFAKKHNNSSFIFRIEDSDVARSKPEYADAIAESLRWLGLNANEGYKIGGDFGPYTQTEKLKRYKQAAEELIDKKLAYRCHCTQDELSSLRNALPEKDRQSFRYPGICREKKSHNSKDYVVRIISPNAGHLEINDNVFGKIVVPNKENYDYVLMRSNGFPLYNFGCVVDDVDQKISHVIRGRDHIINTPVQIIIYNALGAKIPEFAHLPMMLGQDGTKLSKRHGSVSVSEYRKAGYSPSGILNYLARFGWGYKDQEIFSMDELIEKFSLTSCGKNDGKFSPQKFAAIQHSHLKNSNLTSDEEYAHRTAVFCGDTNTKHIKSLVPLIRTKCKTFVEAANELDPIVKKDIVLDQELLNSLITAEVKSHLAKLYSVLEKIEVWNEICIRVAIQTFLSSCKLTLKEIGQPIRVAVFGRTSSPELHATIAAIGKENVLNRIQTAIK